MIKLNYFRGGYLLNTNQNYNKVDIQWLHMGIAQMWEKLSQLGNQYCTIYKQLLSSKGQF